MSGGHFECYGMDSVDGEWRDEELNELFFDLFGGGYSYHSRPFGWRNYDREPRKCEFGPRGGGLFESLDFWLSGDTDEQDYLEDLKKFKDKWFRKTPKNRVEFYKQRFHEYATEIMEQFEREIGGYADGCDGEVACDA